MPFEVMLVAIAGMVTFLIMVRMIAKAETEKARASAAAALDAETVRKVLDDNAAETARLKARIEVLERLATDGDRNLASEINRLHAGQRT
jgi:cellobiose-specific phosphotransferase system component IIB